MLKIGDVLDLGPLGARFAIKKTASDTDGESFDMEWELDPKTGGTPVHIHPHATESYEVLEGDFDVFVDGKWQTLSQGESASVEAGIPHTFRNTSSSTTRVYNKHQPAQKFDEYFEGLSMLVERGIITSDQMTPKAILYLAVLMTTYKEEIVSVSPPDVIMKILGFIGRLFGYKISETV